MPLDLSSLKEAIASLGSSVTEANSEDFMDSLTPAQKDIIIAGVIQNFEFTFELCWKMIKRWLKENIGQEAADPLTRKDLFREAARAGLIKNSQAWFGYSEARNTTSHTYKRSTAETVSNAAKKFYPDASALYEQLESRND